MRINAILIAVHTELYEDVIFVSKKKIMKAAVAKESTALQKFEQTFAASMKIFKIFSLRVSMMKFPRFLNASR